MIVPDMRDLFAPRLLALHAVALAALGAMVVLGVWQLGSYQQQHQNLAAERANAAPVPIDDVLGPNEAFTAEADARPVTVAGSYGDEQLLVDGDDNRTPWLVTPLVTGNGSAVLVVRGRAGSTDDWPPPTGPVTVDGVLLPSQQAEPNAPQQPGVVPALNIARLVGSFDHDLYSGYVILTQQRPAAPDALPLVQPPDAEVPFTTGLRNLMYALQWWAFAAFALFMWWRIGRDLIREQRRSRPSTAPPGDPVGQDHDPTRATGGG